ncbi:Family 3 extracellular solute-binding protein [Sodalis praecaptivus]|uniref:Family 3 extracellular solute-binding protein n=1 Tax=Sodalis praecaptivus TaxID=1239307 RepID=W0HQG1_9GAMM|nr:ABC transporter substrate-binding protein [Sodalis praecaptivus]AHF76029.1 Family 3 extracellular solute-binding protein [Sodalis praecaptivus]
MKKIVALFKTALLCSGLWLVSQAHGAPAAALSVDTALHNQLPAKIKQSGVINLVTDAHYPPCEVFAEDNKTMIGFEPDLWNAMGKVLGVEIKPVSIDFAGLIPGVKSGRYDMAMECISDSAEREKQVSFVNYAYATNEVYTLADNKSITTDPLTLCGLKVGVQAGTDFEHAVTDILNPNCSKNGKAAIAVTRLQSADAVLLALYAGRIDFVLNDAAAAAEIKKVAPRPIRTVAMSLLPKYYLGIVVQKDNTALAQALLGALNVLWRNGEYERIMHKWDLQPVMLEQPGINLFSTRPMK